MALSNSSWKYSSTATLVVLSDAVQTHLPQFLQTLSSNVPVHLDTRSECNLKIPPLFSNFARSVYCQAVIVPKHPYFKQKCPATGRELHPPQLQPIIWERQSLSKSRRKTQSVMYVGLETVWRIVVLEQLHFTTRCQTNW